MEFLKEEYATVQFDATSKIGSIVWNCKAVTHAQYQKALNAQMTLVQKTNCALFISENTNMGIIPIESQQWTNNVFIPKFMHTSIQFYAVVVSKDVFGKVAMNNVIRKIDNGNFTIKTFTTYAEAQAWLKAQKVVAIA